MGAEPRSDRCEIGFAQFRTWPRWRASAYILGTMAEVPEYLLERSRARRAALGLPTSGVPSGAVAPGGGDPPAGGSDTTPAVVAAATPAAAPAASAATHPGIVSAPVDPVDDLPSYAREPGRRTGVPAWMMPILLLLPLWGIVYMGAFGETSSATAEGPNGAEIFLKCAVCHGARGGGGVGPALADSVALTFPDEADHIAFVTSGSAALKGQPYGDPGRPGGQRVAGGGMPGFETSLTPEEIAAVVKFERENL